MKDLLNPWRPSTEAEGDLIQSRLDDIHSQFIDVLVTERHIDRARATALADGRIFTGRQALEEGLIDELGGFDTAVSKAAELANIKGEPHIIRPEDIQFRNVVKSFRSTLQSTFPVGLQGVLQVR